MQTTVRTPSILILLSMKHLGIVMTQKIHICICRYVHLDDIHIASVLFGIVEGQMRLF